MGGGTFNELIHFAEKEKSWLVHWRLLSKCGCMWSLSSGSPQLGICGALVAIIAFTLLKVLKVKYVMSSTDGMQAWARRGGKVDTFC